MCTGPRHRRRTIGPSPTAADLHAERRKPGVTLELFHLEYLEPYQDGSRYPQFCEVHRRWLYRRGPSVRQIYRRRHRCSVQAAWP